MNKIQQAIDAAGSITSLAKGLGVTPQAICFWRDGKRRIPAEKCLLIELATGVSCESLRPDVAWSVLRNKPELAQSPANQAQTAIETVAGESEILPEPDPTAALRTGAARRQAPRRQQDPEPTPGRRHVGPPFQSLEAGVA